MNDLTKIAIELARCRELVRRQFPNDAHQAFAEAQKNPYKVGAYLKCTFDEAKRNKRLY